MTYASTREELDLAGFLEGVGDYSDAIGGILGDLVESGVIHTIDRDTFKALWVAQESLSERFLDVANVVGKEALDSNDFMTALEYAMNVANVEDSRKHLTVDSYMAQYDRAVEEEIGTDG